MDLLGQILADVALRTGGDPPSSVVSTPVMWSDGSLGCPEPGNAYIQVLTPGYRVIVGAGGQTFEYHADRNGRFVLCPPERRSDPARPDTA